MTLHSSRSNELSAREFEQLKHDKEMLELQAETQIKLKQLEVEVLKTDARWNTLFVLPKEVLKLPVRILFGVAYIIGSFRDEYEPGENFWKFIK